MDTGQEPKIWAIEINKYEWTHICLWKPKVEGWMCFIDSWLYFFVFRFRAEASLHLQEIIVTLAKRKQKPRQTLQIFMMFLFQVFVQRRLHERETRRNEKKREETAERLSTLKQVTNKHTDQSETSEKLRKIKANGLFFKNIETRSFSVAAAMKKTLVCNAAPSAGQRQWVAWVVLFL